VNFLDNPALVQFTHRILGIGLVVLAVWLWLRALRAGVTGGVRTALHWVAAAAAIQAGLGISTLLSQVALPLALAHQGGALVLFSLVIWAVYELGMGRRAPTSVPAR
jgi:cytochrome c oxidase assembly protein subunit 15